VSAALADDFFQYSHVVEAHFFITTLALNCELLFPRCLSCVVASVVFTGVVLAGIKSHSRQVRIQACFSIILMQTLQLLVIYYAEGQQRQTFVLIKAIRNEHQRASLLLNSMLPTEVLSEMKAGCMSLAYWYNDMSILFSDICDFTKYCASHSPEQAVGLVTRLFAELDVKTVNLGLYKVCTIGDAYVACGQPRMRNSSSVDSRSDCLAVLSLAKYMIRTIWRVREDVGHPTLNMRIGIHCGAFVGGVIGTQRLRFDVWGCDVLAGNMVESNGIPGAVVVSDAAKRMLERGDCSELRFARHKSVELRNRGAMELFVCQRGDGQSIVEDSDSDSESGGKSPSFPSSG